MGTKPKDEKVEIKGKVNFEGVDRYIAQFKLDDPGGKIAGSHVLDLPAACFPDDFDPNFDEVSGEYSISISIKRADRAPKEKK